MTTKNRTLGYAALALLLTTGCEQPPVTTVETPALAVTPGSIDFGRVWVGRREVRDVTVKNEARVSQPLEVRVEGDFGLEGFPGTVPAASEVVGQVRVEASSGGVITGMLWVGDASVPLQARAEAVPVCQPSAACRDVRFDFDAGACAEDTSADGTNCTASFACFQAAGCRAGACVGTLTTCDDGDACTGDACGQNGCLHYDSSFECPQPNDPCLAPSCDPATGCTSIPVVDGTPCGPRTCSTAAICINGACETRPAPQTQSCTEVIVGWPAGPGTIDGFTRDARFQNVMSMLYHPSGDLFVGQFANGQGGLVRRVSPNGTVRTLAGSETEAGSRDGFGAAARFTFPALLGVDSRGNLVLRDGEHLRRLSPSGQASTVCRGCLPVGRTVFVLPTNEAAVLDGQQYPADNPIEFVDLGTGARRTSTVRSDWQSLLSVPVSTMPLTVCHQRAIGGGLFRLEALPDAGYRWTGTDAGCEAPLGAQRLRADGTTEVLAIDGPATDGPVNQVGLESASLREVRVAVDATGGVALYDPGRFHVRRIENGFMRTLAGPVPRRGLVDGAAPTAQLQGPPASMVSTDAGVLFGDGFALRRLQGTTAQTVVADAGSTCLDLAWWDGTTSWLGMAPPSMTGNVLTQFTAGSATTAPVLPGAISLAVQRDGGLLMGWSGAATGYQPDGGAEALENVRRVRAAVSPRRAYVMGRVGPIGPSFFVVLLEGEGNAELQARFLAPDAGRAAIGHFYEESPGVVVGVGGRRLLRLDTITGQQTVLAELSEFATSIAPAPGGAYVGISDAILLVRFP